MIYKHIRVKEETHNKVLKIKGFYATMGVNVTIEKLIEKMVEEHLLEIQKS